jgi:putative RNA 2'-phosphotransferase
MRHSVGMSTERTRPPGRPATSPDRIGRRLSLILRHSPQDIGLVLDPAGWADVDDLARRLSSHGMKADRAGIEAAVAADNKSRFTLSPDGKRIRAAQGHSIEVSLGLEPIEPPPVLYHGTATSTLDAIHASGGLEPRSRRQVHLSLDIDTATRVGARHGKPIILAIDAAAMHADGVPFYRADNGVWLVDAVPMRYVSYAADAPPAASPA